MSKSVFGRDLSSLPLGDEVSSIDAAVRYAVFHGVQGQFTPASRLSERLHEKLSRKFVGRAALAMLNESLQNYAVPLGAAFRKKPGTKSVSAEEAEHYAVNVIGVEARIARLSKSLADNKLEKIDARKLESAKSGAAE